MDSLTPAMASRGKAKQIKDAQDMFQMIAQRAQKVGVKEPEYDFIELIGKGTFGRVYKCKTRNTGEIVAVKLVDIDDIDYKTEPLLKEETMRDFQKEVGTLQQLKDRKAKNVNLIHEAFDFVSQLWIVSDYCSGGSVHTLLKCLPKNQGLEEHYLIPIARELAIAIKDVHDTGIIHRDIKCGNVLVTEEGRIQLCDFGIAAILEGEKSKRTTIIGTPNWMSPELLNSDEEVKGGYGTEVDIWAFGCTVYEMAIGVPPYASTHPSEFRMAMKDPPRLTGGNYSQGLRDLVAFCLEEKPTDRPSAGDILNHPYLVNTAKKYPTARVVEMIERYAMWEMQGGQRQSLWNPHGAAPPRVADSDQHEETGDDNWNFSTSESFHQAMFKRMSQLQIGTVDLADPTLQAPAKSGLPPIITTELTPFERLQKSLQENSANRGERSLDRVWNRYADKPYQLHTPIDDEEHHLSDLPLRNLSSDRGGNNRETLIDLDTVGDFDGPEPNFNFEFGDIPTIKANRAHRSQLYEDDEEEIQYEQSDDQTKRNTKDWKFPSAVSSLTVPAPKQPNRATMEWTFPRAEASEAEDLEGKMSPPSNHGAVAPGFRPTLKHTATEPIGHFRDFLHPSPSSAGPLLDSPLSDSVVSMIDLDLGMSDPDPADIERPSTANSATGSTMTDMTSGNPFDLEEDDEQNERDRQRFSYHKHWRSEPVRMTRPGQHSRRYQSRGVSMSSTDSEFERNFQDFDYNGQLPNQGRKHMLDFSSSGLDNGNWSRYDSDSTFDLDFAPMQHGLRIPAFDDQDYPFNQTLRTNGTPLSQSISRLRDTNSTQSNGQQRSPVIDFSVVRAPDPATMLEGASSDDLMGELVRQLDDMEDGFKAAINAFHPRYTGGSIEMDSAMTGDESGLESSFAASADEGGY